MECRSNRPVGRSRLSHNTSITPAQEALIVDLLDKLETVAELIDTASEYADEILALADAAISGIGAVGDTLGDLADASMVIGDVIEQTLADLFAIGVNTAKTAVTMAINNLNGMTVAGFDITVTSVTLTDGGGAGLGTVPFHWDVIMNATRAFTANLDGGGNSTLGVDLTGGSLAGNAEFDIDFRFGLDAAATPFVILNTFDASLDVNVTGLAFAISSGTGPSGVALTVAGGTASISASASAATNTGTYTGGVLTAADLAAIGAMSPTHFSLSGSGSVNVNLPLTGTLTLGGATLTGSGVFSLVDADLFDGTDAATDFDFTGATFDIQSAPVEGNFAITRNGSGDTIVTATITSLEFSAGATSILDASGSGTFLIQNDGDVAGTATLSLLSGPALAGIGLSAGGTFGLEFNTASSAVANIDGVAVGLPAGDYLRVTGTGVELSFGAGSGANGIVSGDFVFEQTTTTTADDVVFVSATNLSLLASAGGASQADLTAASANFFFLSSGFFGEASGALALNVGSISSLSGTFSLRVNTTGSAQNKTANLADGSTVGVSVAAGPYLRLEGTGVTASVSIGGASYDLAGDFAFEQSGSGATKELVLGITNASTSLKDGAGNTIVSVTGAEGGFVLTPTQTAGYLENATVTIQNVSSVAPVALTGTFDVAFNDGAAINQSITVAGNTVTIDVDAGPLTRVGGTGVALTMSLGGASYDLSGDFAFEQTGSGASQKVVVGVTGASTALTDGSGNTIISVSGADGGLVLTTTQTAGYLENAAVSVQNVSAISPVALTGTFDVKFNDGALINESITVGGSTVTIDVEAGPLLRVGGTGVTLTASIGGIDYDLSGDFAFEQTGSGASQQVVAGLTNGATSLTNGGGTEIISVTGADGGLVLTTSQTAGYLQNATVSVQNVASVLPVALTGTFGVEFNDAATPINETITVAGSTVTIDVDAGPLLRVTGSAVTLTLDVAGFETELTGDFSFEKLGSPGSEVITVDVMDAGFALEDHVGNTLIEITDADGQFVFDTAGSYGAADGNVTITVPGISNVSGTFTFQFNDTLSSQSVTVSAATVALPAGPYFRLSGDDVAIDFTIGGLTQTVTGDFSIEQTTVGAEEKLAVGFEDLSMDFEAGGLDVLSFTDGSGAFLFDNAGFAGEISNVTVTAASLPGFVDGALTGSFALKISNQAAALNETISTSSQGSILLDLPAGPYLRIDGTGIDIDLSIGALSQNITGNISFEQQVVDGNELIAVGFSDASLTFTVSGTDLITVSDASGAFLSGTLTDAMSAATQDGFAGVFNGTVAVNGGPIVSTSGTFAVAINTTTLEIDEDVTVAGSTIAVEVAAAPSISEPYLRIDGTGVTLTLDIGGASFEVSGNVSFERDSTSRILVGFTDLASTLEDTGGNDLLVISDGTGGFVWTDTDFYGTANVTIATGVPGIASISGTFDLDINSSMTAQSETITVGDVGSVMIDIPAGPYLRVAGIGASVELDIAGFNQTISGNVTFERQDTPDGRVVSLGFQDITAVWSNGGTTLLTISDGDGAFVIDDTGVAGVIENVTVTTGPTLASKFSLAGTFGLEVNTRPDAVDTSVTVLLPDDSSTAVAIDLPAGEYLRIAGTGVSLSVTIAGNTQTITGDFAVEQFNDITSGDTQLKIGVSNASASFTAGSLGLTLSGGSGAFLVTDAGIAGEAAIDVVTPTGLPGAISITANNLRLAFNNTGADVASTTISTSLDPASTTTIEFVGAYYHDYLAVRGSAAIDVGFATLNGNFGFEQATENVNGGGPEDVFKVAVSDLNFDFNADTTTILSFQNGEGLFVIDNDGIAGELDLEFASGIVNLSGDMMLQFNTGNVDYNGTGSGIMFDVPAADGSTTSATLAITEHNFFRLCVHGSIQLGSFTNLGLDFEVERIDVDPDPIGEDFLIQINNKSGGTLVQINDDGVVSNLGGLTAGLFNELTPEKIVNLLRQLSDWFQIFRNSDFFETSIPFTDYTLGDVFDFGTAFLDTLYSNLVNVQIGQGDTGFDFAATPVDFSSLTDPIALRVGTGGAEIELDFSGVTDPLANSLAEAVDAINEALAATTIDADGTLFSSLVEAVDDGGVLAIRLTPSAITQSVNLVLVEAGALADAAFADGNVAAVLSQAKTVQALIDIIWDTLGLGTGIKPTYDPLSQILELPITFSYSLSETIDFDLSGDLGTIAGANLTGSFEANATLGFTATIGLDLGAFDVPRVLTSTAIPVPSDGITNDDATFQLRLDEGSVYSFTLPQGNYGSIEGIATAIQGLFAAQPHGGGMLSDFIVAQKAGQGIAISLLNEVDTNEDGILDASEDLNGNGTRELRLGEINKIEVLVEADDVAATELGFGNDPSDAFFNLIETGTHLLSVGLSPQRGLYLDDVAITASASLNTPSPITGGFNFGFLGVEASNGQISNLNPYTGVSDDFTFSLALEDQTTGATKFYLADLFGGLVDFGNMFDGPNLDGTFYASLAGISVTAGLSVPLSGAELAIFIPDITNLSYNPDPYVDGVNDEGIFLIANNFDAALNFQKVGFVEIVNALDIITDNLAELQGFGFLNEDIPVINASISDLVDYAAQVADILAAAASGDAENLQQMIADIEAQLESLFGLPDSVLTVSLDSTADPTVANAGTYSWDLTGEDNAIDFMNVTGSLANILFLPDENITDDSAAASWDEATNTLTVRFNNGVTDAAAIVTAANAVAGWNVSLGTDSEGVGNDGSGSFQYQKTAIRFELDLEAGYADAWELDIDLVELLSQIPSSGAAASLLGGASSFIQAGGSAQLSVSAVAALNLDFGLDLTNHCEVRPFIYDTTGVVLTAHVLGSDVDFEASLGGLIGIEVRNGSVTFDADGEVDSGPPTDPDNGDASFTVGLNDPNGDGRIYFDEFVFDTSMIDITLDAGLGIDLPLFFSGIAIGGAGMNSISLEIPDLTSLFDGSGTGINFSVPDFTDLFADLDLCTVIFGNADTLLDGLDSLLGRIENGLNELAFNQDLPLIGDGLGAAADAATFINDFRSGLLAEIREEIDASGGALEAIENAIKDAFWNILGQDGLDLLVDPTTGEAFAAGSTSSVLDISLDCETGLFANLRLAKVADLVDTTDNPLDFDIGVPGFNLEVDANLQIEFGFDFKLRFGINKEDGFFFVTAGGHDWQDANGNLIQDAGESGTSDPELYVYFSITIPDSSVSGELFFLQLDVIDGHDGEDGSEFSGYFAVDLMDPNNDGKLTWSEMTSGGTSFSDIVDPRLAAEADVNLDLIGSFGGNAAFPRILADFDLNWEWSLEDGAGDLEVGFNNIGLDLGTFISDFLAPIFEEIQKITEPIQPIVDLVTLELPVLSDLAGKPITLLDLAEAFGYLDPSTRQFIEAVAQIVTVINSIPTSEGTIIVPLGGFNLGQSANGDFGEIDPTDVQEAIDLATTVADVPVGPQVSSDFQAQSEAFVNNLGSLDNFSFPVFEDPSQIFGLFMGNPVSLVEWRMPTFKFEFSYTQSFPIFGPLFAELGGSVGAEFNIGFGYDTFGIQKFLSSEDRNAIDILDGFYVIDHDENGNDIDEIVLRGEVFAGAKISLLIAEAGVRGGLGVEIGFDLNDPNGDGRYRVSEIVSNALIDPRCIFNIHGEFYIFLEAFLKVDLFLFSIDKTWRFGEFTLFEFELTCPEPVLANVDGSGVLTLHIGPNAGDREELDTSDGAEEIVVQHIEGDGTNETVEVTFAGYTQTFTGVSSIVADGGANNDIIDLRGVLADISSVVGGEGDDTIYLGEGDAGALSGGQTAHVDGGDGNDTILVGLGSGFIIEGGAGNDIITAGSAAVTIRGGSGNDTITGSSFDDTLEGESGNDIIVGGAGIDTINGGSGSDDIDSGSDDDIVDGGSGNDTIVLGTGNDQAEGGEGADHITGGSGDDKINGGDGNDIVIGGSGNDYLTGGNDDDRLEGQNGEDVLVGDIATITSNLEISGISGQGNDVIIGGGAADVIFGGAGDDYLFGGNLSAGETIVFEEDGNDFIDGGAGNDEIFGDDAFGRTGDRNTGISVASFVFFDSDGDGIYNESAGDTLVANVTVNIYEDGTNFLADTANTDTNGNFTLTGLKAKDYYIEVIAPSGGGNFMFFTTPNATTDESIDSDIYDSGPDTGLSPVFTLEANQQYTDVTIGLRGDSLIAVSDASVVEADAGQTSEVTLTVSLSAPSDETVRVDYNTAYDALNAPNAATVSIFNAVFSDYEASVGTLVFEPGELVQTITLQVNGDANYENLFESFLVDLSPGTAFPSDVEFANDQARIYIVEDDPIPTLSVSDHSPGAGDIEGGTATFTVSLSGPSKTPVSVQYATEDILDGTAGTPLDAAFGGADYTPVSGTLNFSPGQTELTVTVPILGDLFDEYDERFYLRLFNVTGDVDLVDAIGVAQINDDDATPTVEIRGAGGLATETVVEQDYVNTSISFEIFITGPTEREITVFWSTQYDTAVPEFLGPDGTSLLVHGDYIEPEVADDLATDGALTFFPGGPTSQFVDISVKGDVELEATEYFFVNLLEAENAEITQNHAIAEIIDDDGVPPGPGTGEITFEQATYEFDEELGFFKVRLTRGEIGEAVAVIIDAAPSGVDPATDGVDFFFTRQMVIFDEDDAYADVFLLIFDDDTYEGDETFTLSMRLITGQPLASTTEVTISDESDRPFLQVVEWFDATEPSAGSTTSGIFAQLVDASGTSVTASVDVTFTASVSDVTATLGDDYSIGTLDAVISAGSSFAFFFINALPGANTAEVEPIETARLTLTNVVGADSTPQSRTALFRILDNDTDTVEVTVFNDKNGNGFQDGDELGISGVDVTFTDEQGTVVMDTTDENGIASGMVHYGAVTVLVDETSTALTDLSLTTGNESQSAQFNGSSATIGLVGYQSIVIAGLDIIEASDAAGVGGTDDTLFGGPGNDVISGGGGYDNIVGGHWYTATSAYSPVNDTVTGYDATLILDPTGKGFGPVYEVDTSITWSTVTATIWDDTANNDDVLTGADLRFEGVQVHIYDGAGSQNRIASGVTDIDGEVTFDRLLPGAYFLEVELPDGFQLVMTTTGTADGSDFLENVNRTADFVVTSGATVTEFDGGLIDSAAVGEPVASGNFSFDRPSYSVLETDPTGEITIAITRSNAFEDQAIILTLEDGSATSGLNYETADRYLLIFDVGVSTQSFTIGILNDPVGMTNTYVSLSLRDITGRPADEAVLWIIDDTSAHIADDDIIYAGGGDDIVLGDSGWIDANATPSGSPTPGGEFASGSLADNITFTDGLGRDELYGELNDDLLYGRLGEDILDGDEGNDGLDGGFDDDQIIVSIHSSYVDGGEDDDTVFAEYDGDFLLFSMSGVGELTVDVGVTDQFFFLENIENVDLTGGARDNTFDVQFWDGGMQIDGAGGEDNLIVTHNDLDMILQDTSVALANGSAYQFTSIEEATLVGGAGNNTLDASLYSFGATLIGNDGDDTLIGGPGDDTFYFELDALFGMGTDTVIGGGGIDTLDFSATSNTYDLDVTLATGLQTVEAGLLALDLPSEDIENIVGGAGNDMLTGNALTNRIDGRGGNDTIAGAGGDDFYEYNADATTPWDADTIIEFSGDGDDTIDFSATTTSSIVFDLSLGGVQTFGPNSITVAGDADFESLIGGEGDDILIGNGIDNRIYGRGGDDLLNGAGGDDLLDGGDGNDDLDGGDGTDRIEESTNSDVYLSNSLLQKGSEVDTLANLESADITGGSAGQLFTIGGFEGAVNVVGGQGTVYTHDIGIGLHLPNVLINPVDTFNIEYNGDLTLLDNILVATIDGTMYNYTFSQFEAYALTGGVDANTIVAPMFNLGPVTINGGGGDDILIGSPQDDTINGGEGDDQITGGAGDDDLDGGNGDDTFLEDDISIALINDLDFTLFGSGNDTLASLENASLTAAAAGSLFAVYSWTAGDLTLIGGAGVDVAGVVRDADITITDTLVTFSDGGAPIILSGIDSAIVVGGAGDNILDGSAFTGDLTLTGGLGNDTLIAGAGDDTLNGDFSFSSSSGGNDTYVFDTDTAGGNDVIFDEVGIDTLDFSATTGQTQNIDLVAFGAVNANLSLSTSGATLIENVIGGDDSDFITGNAADNLLIGGAGKDDYNGGGGTDTVLHEEDTNIDVSDATLDIGPDSEALVSIEHVHLIGGAGNNFFDASAVTAFAVTLEGRGGNDALAGGSADDLLIGGAGINALQGGDGDDIYQINADTDLGDHTIFESVSTDIDTIDFSATTTTGVSIDLGDTASQAVAPGVDIQINTDDTIENVIGTAFADTLTGNALDNTFIGNGGADVINGDGGSANTVIGEGDTDFTLTDTTLTTSSATVTISNIQQAELTGGASANIIDASNFTLGRVILRGLGGFDTLIGGTADDILDGGEGNDTLYGGEGNDVLNGGDGDDTLYGGDDDDTLEGDGGDDQLYGGSGDDIYFFDLGVFLGSDTIYEYLAEGAADTIDGVGAVTSSPDLTDTAAQTISASNLNLTLANLNVEITNL